MSENFDVIVIGAGPGGYVCAIRAAQLGLKVACVEKRETLGGTCLNVGCIPSKALLQSSEEFEHTQHALKDHGVLVEGVKLDLARMLARKGEVVTANVKGVEFLFKKNKITWLKGERPHCRRRPGRCRRHGLWRQAHRDRHRQRERAAGRGRRGRDERSSPPPARWNWTRCPAIWW